MDPYTLIACAKIRSNHSFVTMRKLLENGCNSNVQDENGKTALHYACQRGVGVNMLLNAGADPNISDGDGNTPMLVASTEGFDEIICSLLEFGCKTDVLNSSGKAAIHFLAMKNHHRAISAIAQSGGDVNLEDSTGRMPLWYAINHNRHRAVKTLLRANCMVDSARALTTDGASNVILKLALDKGLYGITKLLVLAGCDLTALHDWLNNYEQEQNEREQARAERVRLFADSDDESDSENETETPQYEAYQWLQDWVGCPHTLMQLCRIAIRRFIGKHILQKAEDLPVPKPIIDYITLKEVEDHPLQGQLI